MRQCQLLDVPKSSFYYQPCGESALSLELMNCIDAIYLKFPFYGSPRMTDELRSMGYGVNPKRVERLMRKMALVAVVPGPSKRIKPRSGEKHPYLLAEVEIVRPNQVWCTDITYIRLQGGFVYLTAVMDWYSRYVLAWELSNSLEAGFCVDALQCALRQATPEIMNTDQGPQYTGDEFLNVLKGQNVRISMAGRGRCFDNIMIERLWRTVKYEDVYIWDYRTVPAAYESLREYFEYYNHRRRHSSLDGQVPAAVYV